MDDPSGVRPSGRQTWVPVFAAREKPLIIVAQRRKMDELFTERAVVVGYRKRQLWVFGRRRLGHHMWLKPDSGTWDREGVGSAR